MIDVPEIKAYMARQNDMTNKELAHKLGVSPATLGRWFEKRDMPTSAAEKVIAALQIPLAKATGIFFTAM